MMSTKEVRQHVYICQFAAPGYDEPGMAAFDNADSALDFANEVRKHGCGVKGLFKLGVLTSVEETLDELGWKTNGN